MIEHRFLLKCKTVTPLVHATGIGHAVTDQVLRRSAAGSLIIAGSSIAGRLRSRLEEMDGNRCDIAKSRLRRDTPQQPCNCRVCSLFGNCAPGDIESSGNVRARASRIWVFDSTVEPGAETAITDSVGIERTRKSAQTGMKFDREELSLGACFWLDIRGEELSDQEINWLSTALSELGGGELTLGGGAASGYGKLECHESAIYRRDLSVELLKVIDHDSHQLPAKAGDELPAWPSVSRNFHQQQSTYSAKQWSIALRLCPNESLSGTFLVSDPVAATVSSWDRAPRGYNGGKFEVDLPSRSVRGALRSGAERILLTLANDSDQAILTAQAMLNEFFGSTAQASRLQVTVQPDASNRPSPSPGDHVAIDRFTGGATDTRKFDALAARGGEFTLQLEITHANESDLEWMKGLLLLVLRDLDEGRITLGHGSSKGHGFFNVQASRQTPETHWFELFSTEAPIRNQWVRACVERTNATHERQKQERTEVEVHVKQEIANEHECRTISNLRELQTKTHDECFDEQPTCPETSPSQWSIYSGTCSTADLVTRTAAFQYQSNALMFIEGPICCQFFRTNKSSDEIKRLLESAWHYRWFDGSQELAGRRLGFGKSDGWQLRWSLGKGCDVNEASNCNLKFIVNTESNLTTCQSIALMGSTREENGRFIEQRFGSAVTSMEYPGQWPANTRLILCTEQVHLSDGEIVIWVGIKQYRGERS